MAPAALPKGFAPIQEILDGEIGKGKMVSVAGLVQDCRLPVATQGKNGKPAGIVANLIPDHKMEVTLCDLSTEESCQNIKLSIFRPVNQMPRVGAGDVVLALVVKVWEWSGSMSLLTNHATVLHVYSRGGIPKPPQSAASALKERCQTSGRDPTQKESEYVSYLYHTFDKTFIPDQEAFQRTADRSLNVKQKFRTLAEISDGNFHDLIVQVVREPWDTGDKVTLWVSDYTTNNAFFQQSWSDNHGGDGGRDGDPYGYTSKFAVSARAQSSSQWTGPFGKMSMQITCWDPNAEFIRKEVKINTWVHLRNVQIRYGRNGQNLEGFLRQDQTYTERVNIDTIHTDADPIDPRLKEALLRKRDYERAKKQQIRQFRRDQDPFAASSFTSETPTKSAVAPKAPAKRNAEATEPEFVAPTRKQRKKQRRKKNREPKQKAYEEEQKGENGEALCVLNPQVVCEHDDKETSLLSTLLEPIFYESRNPAAGEKPPRQIPFINMNYRVNVRIVDFAPARLEDFAWGRRISEYDMLSNTGDSDGGEDDDDDDDDDDLDSDPTGNYSWEWRFSLELEDASTSPPNRVWVHVSNNEGQLLTNLDAVDLRNDDEALRALRESMFILWGNLEEIKQAKNALESSRRRPIAHMPPLSSDPDAAVEPSQQQELSNTPFPCCVRQYGVSRRAGDSRGKPDADGKHWERVFGMFGTKIRA